MDLVTRFFCSLFLLVCQVKSNPQARIIRYGPCVCKDCTLNATYHLPQEHSYTCSQPVEQPPNDDDELDEAIFENDEMFLSILAHHYGTSSFKMDQVEAISRLAARYDAGEFYPHA